MKIWVYCTWLFGVSCITLSSSQSFTKQPSPVLGVKDLQAVFECQATGISTLSYYWTKDGSNMTRGTSVVKDQVASLTISGLKFGDAGQYRCIATGSITLTSNTATLTVKGSPDIVQGPSAISPHVGQAAVFVCITVGNPTPAISWTNPSSQPIISSGRFHVYVNGTLVINNIQKVDAGYYTCKSSNDFGQTSAFAELTVLDAPAPPIFTTTPNNQTAREGTDVTFYCEANGVPNPTITWTRVGGAMPSGRQDEPRPGALRIKTILPSDDGTYVCEATNTQGTRKAYAYLRIEGYPRFTVSPSDVVITEFSHVILTCVVTGDPTPSVAWALPSGAMVTAVTSPITGVQVLANNTLVISNVTEAHHGEYTCVAKNAVGERRQKAMISVLSVPRFNSMLPNVTRTIHGMIDITCPSRGNPPPEHQWVFGGKIVSRSRTLSLVLLNVTNQGYYTCRVNNSVGVNEESFYLRVMVPPAIVTAPSNQTISLGSSTRFTCHTAGDPPPVVTWETASGSVAGQPRYSVLANGTLVITMVTHADTGWLTCQATNAAGMMARKAYLIVSDLPMFTQSPSNHTLVKGSSITLHCSATAADTPVITWYKSDQSGALNKVTSVVTLASGDLHFTSVKRQDKGMYACQACNTAGCRMTPPVLLNVLYNPLFPVPPPDVGVLQGQDAKLVCKPESSPQATITWTRPDGTVMPGTGYTQIIHDVQPADTGVYKCSARNDYGSTSEQSITLAIQTKAAITDITKQTTSNVLVTCDVTGTPTPTIVWYLGNVALPQNVLHPEYSVTRDSKLRLPIGALENKTFICNASNAHAIVVHVAKVPVPPTNVTVTSVTSQSVVVSWARPSPLTYLVTHYQLDMWSADTSWTILSNNTKILSYSVPNLSSFTMYRFRLRAVNGLGTSENSLPSQNTTTLSSEPSVPRDLRLTVRNASVLIVTWSVPQHLHGPLRNLQYHVTYFPKVPNTTNNEFRIAHDSSSRPQEYTIAGLHPDTAYTVEVRAGRRRSQDGVQLWSEAVDRSARTRQLVPMTPPIDLAIYPNGGSQIMLRWKKPPYSISGYHIWYKVHRGGSPYKKVHISDGLADTYVIMDLEKDTQYEVRIQMYSNSGLGPLSLAQVVKTDEDTFSAGESKKDQGLSWKIAVGGLVCGLLLLALVIGIVWYRKKNSTRHRQSFRISTARNRPDYLVGASGSEGSVRGIPNDALDADVDLNMFEHGTHDATADHNDRQLQYMDPANLEFGNDMMQEVPVASGDHDVYLERYSPRDVQEHYDAVENPSVETPTDNVPEPDLSPAGSINGFPVYAQVNKAAKKNRNRKYFDNPEDDITGVTNPIAGEVPSEQAPTYDGVEYGARDNTRGSPQDDLDHVPSAEESPTTEHIYDNEPLSVDVPPFPERKNTTASEVSIEFPPPPPIHTLPPDERDKIERNGSEESDFSDSLASEGQPPIKPPRTYEEYGDDVPSEGQEGSVVPAGSEAQPPSDNEPRKRRMVADWGDDAPMDNLWEQLDKELDKRLGT